MSGPGSENSLLGTGPQGTVGAFRTGGENVFTEFVCNVIVLCSSKGNVDPAMSFVCVDTGSELAVAVLLQENTFGVLAKNLRGFSVK